MRVLLVGATGFIGSAVKARLTTLGHEVVSVSRNAGARQRADAEPAIVLDIARATKPEDWLPHLAGIDAIVNAAGTLQDGLGESTRGVHRDGVAALYAAAEQAGVRRVVHISAIGVDRGTPTAFSQTKLAGDQILMSRKLDWVVLRPAVVVGRTAFGGSALFRGLAALPAVFEMGRTGPLQIVQLDDLVETVLFFLRPGAPARKVLDIAGPERFTMTEAVQLYRRWLGRPPGRVIGLPDWLGSLVYRLGDVAGLLGWRPPVRSTARVEIRRGATGDIEPWTRLTGIAPKPLGLALAEAPAGVQERWFARLYMLKPLIFLTFALFWIGTGVISLGPGWEIGVGYMLEGGAGPLAAPSVVAGALADIAIGILLLFRRTARAGLLAALAVSVFYLLAGTAILPRLWADPLGPMWKIWPILGFNLVALAILDER